MFTDVWGGGRFLAALQGACDDADDKTRLADRVAEKTREVAVKQKLSTLVAYVCQSAYKTAVLDMGIESSTFLEAMCPRVHPHITDSKTGGLVPDARVIIGDFFDFNGKTLESLHAARIAELDKQASDLAQRKILAETGDIAARNARRLKKRRILSWGCPWQPQSRTRPLMLRELPHCLQVRQWPLFWLQSPRKRGLPEKRGPTMLLP